MGIYSERAYFDGDHCAHCAARDEFMRLARIRNALDRALGKRVSAIRALDRRNSRR